jgi:hypothetical protein
MFVLTPDEVVTAEVAGGCVDAEDETLVALVMNEVVSVRGREGMRTGASLTGRSFEGLHLCINKNKIPIVCFRLPSISSATHHITRQTP